MKLIKSVLVILVLLLGVTTLVFAKGRLATSEDVDYLKKDLLAGKIKVGITRLSQISDRYGDPEEVAETTTKITYDYGDLKIEFDKIKYFRAWAYDSRYGYAFKDEVDDLRYDLETGQLVGDFTAYSDIVGDYSEPTAVGEEKTEDGQKSTYYWGDIRLTFENYIVVRSWKGKKLGQKTAE